MAEPTQRHQDDELHSLKELVDEVYSFRDCYFVTHSESEAGKKQGEVAQKMQEALRKLEEKEERFRHKAAFLLQKGRCLNVAPEFSVPAEECLSRAVKLEPGLVEAWNTLGEQYWKKADLSKNKVSLRNMSMVLRQLPSGDGEEQSKRVMEGVDMARQAVQMDVTDGTSWYILGNAYVSLFFTCGQNPQMSQQALSAYAQSEKVDVMASSYPELHFNRASLFQYEEMFGSALAGYSRAAALDPGWEEPPERERQLLEYLGKVTELMENKGKVKARRLRTMLSGLSTSSSSSLGPCASPQFKSHGGRVGSLEPRPLASLTHGYKAGVAALGKVVFSLAPDGRMAFWGVLIGDTVVIPEPNVKRQSVLHKDQSFDFRSIRVDTPLHLIVNGKRQNAQSQIVAGVSYKPQSE
ncbi:hypothetical protein NHX12_014220 [Muraenolepis orangiensis]|uniref:Tetratricopeptide repeat protein 5 OB fold domain-containing protein n=1 Tax=Muraenolepis orangiensis TaxID=630683 RepID=A0A9Q0DBW5_9TELE|nr:hypothetical protein NHX12_014220 [Muraenolepis orangiensis]